ncbi:MAG: hypothetical protein K2H18_01530, partial [Muribaculaceae bacterium]|nr:hypothetical protein [Muribaculaceae bacterium]
MKIDIESVKDAVYELEGLLELAELRDDKLTALLPLMRNKLDIINSLFKDVEIVDQEDVKEEYAEEDESFVTETGSSEAEDETSEATEEISGEEDEFSETEDMAVEAEADEKIFEAEYDDYEKVSPETSSPELPLERVQESEEEDWNVIRVIDDEDEREDDHK